MLKSISILVLSFGISIAATACLFGQGAIINEISNGPTGTQEFFELVVIGPNSNPNCGPVDLRGWFVDDNNGDFSCGPCAGTGIATGHIRFSSTSTWAAVPTGSIIVLYDDAVKNPAIPADDPNDTSPADGVYILPLSHPSLEVSTATACANPNIPSGLGACGTCGGDASYLGACYVNGSTSNIGLRNSGDAAQVRNAAGAYFHGIGYGTGSSGINGGPDNLFISGTGSGTYFIFDNSASNDFRSAANFSSGLVSSLGETPGAANTAQNAAWITSLSTPCLLPVTFIKPFEVRALPNQNLLQWATSYEYESKYFAVFRSTNPNDEFVEIGRVNAAGNSNQTTRYEFVDYAPPAQHCWYQLREYDLNGETHTSEMVEVFNSKLNNTYFNVAPNPSSGKFHISGTAIGLQELRVCNATGQQIFVLKLDSNEDAFERDLDLSGLPNGIYLVQLSAKSGIETLKVILEK